MNRATDVFYEEMDQRTFGQLLCFVFEHKPELYHSVRDLYKEQGRPLDPLPLVKYAIRTYPGIRFGERSINLAEMRRAEDPYELVTYWRFSGRFGYDPQHEAYRPVGRDVRGTRRMKSLHEQTEQQRICSAWAQAKAYLSTPENEEPTLMME